MPKPETFIVLEGYLYDSFEFEFLRGYELDRAPLTDRIRREDKLIIAKLLNKAGQPLVEVTPEVSFPVGCSATFSTAGMGLLLVVLPLHPDAVSIELHTHYNAIIFSAPVSKTKPPAVTLQLEPSTQEAFIQFKMDASAEIGNLAFFLIDAAGRKLSATPNASEDIYSIDLRPCMGQDELRLYVSVSRGFRTSETFSPPFEVPVGKIRGRILEPKNGSQWSAGQPGSLMGNLFYNSGKAVAWDSATTSWAIDGLKLNDSQQIAVLDVLPPGAHQIELRYEPAGGNLVVLDQAQIQVLPETEDQKQYTALLAEYLALKEQKSK